MIIKLEGTTFHVSGTFKSFPAHAELEASLRERGAKLCALPNLALEVVIAGEGADLGRKEAASRNKPVMEEAELATLLESGEVEIDFTEREINRHLFSKQNAARRILARKPSKRGWEELTKIFEACDEEQTAAVTELILDHTQDWSRREFLLCEPNQAWLLSMFEGENSPRHQLIRRLDFGTNNYKPALIKKLLKRKHLTNVIHLDLANKRKQPKTLYRVVATDKKLANLEHFSIGYFDMDYLEELEKGDNLAKITRLGHCPSELTGKQHIDDETYRALLGSHLFANVKRLVFHYRAAWNTSTARVLGFLEDSNLLPAFEHLEFDYASFGKATKYSYSANIVRFTLEPPGLIELPNAAADRVKTLTIHSGMTGHHESSGNDIYDLRRLRNLETLRLYGTPHHNPDDASFLQSMNRVFGIGKKVRLPGSFKQLVTNLPLDHGPVAEFAQNYPEVEVTHDPLPDPLRIE